MNETKTHEEESIQKLLEEAGPRPALPEDDLAVIKEAARGQWRRQYANRGKSARPARWSVALAAAALLAVVGLLWRARSTDQTPAPAATVVASVERLTGAAWEASGKSPAELLSGSVGRPLSAGVTLETGADSERLGRLALRMAGGASLRLDGGTRVRLTSATVVELDRGAVYVDTGAGPNHGDEIAVSTPAGLFQGIGTQFEVRAEGGGVETRLRVREGSVRLDRKGESLLTDTGHELIVRGDGSLDRHPTAVHGPEWDWVLKTAPMPDIEGVTVRTFLDWIARETGRRVEFADEETASLCDSIVLHGSIAHLTPAEAPGVVLSSSGLRHRLSGGTLVVFVGDRSGR